ncbi:MAG: ATP-dependent RecD-like DNA helicase [Bacillota bacterium]
MKSVEGTIKHITFYNEDNAYAVLKVMVKENASSQSLFSTEDDVVTVTGYLPKPIKGETYRFFGEYTTHDKYGEQFTAKSYEKVEPANIEGIKDYLASDLFKGIGDKTAEHIVDALGKDTINKIVDDPSVLDDIPKLSDKQKDTLKEGIIQNKASERTLIELYGYGISSKMAMRIISVYEEETLAKIKTNPYQMIYDVEGIGFERADHIAMRLGFEKDDNKRIKALLVYIFQTLILKQGHTYIARNTFIQECMHYLEKNETLEHADTLINNALNDLIESKLMTVNDDNLTLTTIARAEQEIVTKLSHLTAHTSTIDKQKVYSLIQAFETKENLTYTSVQRQAILNALTHQTMILTGGPGTGKTTVIKGLIHVYYTYHDLTPPREDQSSLIHLIAPTGRAAKRMQESTSVYATTIHRFLGYSYDGSFMHNKYNPVEGNLFIVDEASMIDVFLASQLMQSLPDYANLVFVGDDAQLPSVGPGQVFKDLIDSKTIPTITLDVIHRQSKDSHIIDLARHMRKGSLPSDLLQVYPDRYVFKETTNNFQNRLKSIIDYMMKEGYTLHDDIQVLIPMYRGSVGIDETNAFLQDIYNKTHQPGLEHFNRTFKVGDKVLQLTNQIEDGIMNGDQGIVKAIDYQQKALIVEFLGQTVNYKSKDLVNLRLAYAMSIHKAQGSEYGVVIVPIFKSYSIMLKRKLIYTAITRAKDKVVLFGDVEKLAYAVKSVEESRHTGLKALLQATLTPLPSKKRTDAPLPLKRETSKEQPIYDQEIPFDTLGEDLDAKTPYDFLTDDDKHE